MFEEAATKYSNDWRILKSSKLNFAELVELRAVIYKANKEGAEFGYNKAKEDADKMKSQFLELCNLKDMRIKELEKVNEWHDLRKNPNDLPDTDRNVYVKRQSENECQIDNYYKDDKGWGIMFRDGWCTDDVILWCELPVLPTKGE